MARSTLLQMGLAGGIALAAQPAAAVDDVLVLGDLHVNAGIEMGVGGFYVDNPNFGVGRVDLRSGNNTGDAVWGEGYVEPSVNFTFDPAENLTLFGEASVVFAATVGEGDAGGFTDGDEGDATLEKASLGFRTSFSGPGETPWTLELSGGKQDVQIGDGWLFWDGNFDAFGDTAYWLAPRTAFEWAGTADLSNGSLGLKPFYIIGDHDQDSSEIIGGDLRFEQDWGSLGVLYANVLDSNDNVFTRDGMQMVSARALGVGVPAVEGLSFSGEFTKQFGSEGAVDYDAYALYGQADYNFAGLPWSPTLTYRYARFSGDGNPNDNDVEAFDPLFYGFSGGWGTWFQGEIVGEYYLFNSNQRNHMVKLALAPTESLGVGAIYYHFGLDENNFFGTPVSDRSFADEINIFADWTFSDHVYVSGVAGVAFPGQGAEDAFGDDRTIFLLEGYLVVTY